MSRQVFVMVSAAPVLLGIVLVVVMTGGAVRAQGPSGSPASSDPMIVAQGHTVQDVFVVNNSVIIHGRVTGDILVINGDLTVLAGGRVGDSIAVLGGHVDIKPRARVSGSVVQFGGDYHWLTPGFGLLLVAGYKIVLALAVLLLGLLATFLFPCQIEALDATLRQMPARTTLAGFVGALLAVVLILLLTLTVVGIPVALVLITLALLATVLGVTLCAGLLGRRIATGPARRQVMAGLAVLGMIALVPFIGEGMLGLAGMAGLGAVLLALVGRARPAA